MSIEHTENVQPFDFEQVGNMEDQTVIELFLSQLGHPGVSKSPHELARAIQDFSGQGNTVDDPFRQLSRDRMLAITRATAAPSNNKWDELTDPDNEEMYDPLFTEISFRLRQVRDLNDYQDVRRALFTLQDILLTSYRLDIDAIYTIQQMVAFLCANLEDG